MPKVAYIERAFSTSSLTVIEQANAIIAEYQMQGFQLTLRQLYYQFVSRDYIPNTTRSYKRLGSIINDGRMAGLVDWNAIEDRTREVVTPSHWSDPSDIIEASANCFRIDKWRGQEYRPEVWIEKEALAGVFERICTELDIPYLSCRGYTSQSEMWSSAMRLKRLAEDCGQTPIILHFGDHDPSGIDMTRDIVDRMETFIGGVELRRLALNMPQIEQYGPPANPAKVTDSRFTSYQSRFGDESWELDALEPSVLADLVRREVESIRDGRQWAEANQEERHYRELLSSASDRWNEVCEFLEKEN